MLKRVIFLLVFLSVVFLSLPTNTFAVIQNLNGLTPMIQSFANDSNITITSSGSTHALNWNGLLPISRGGTGTGAFTSGSIPFIGGGGFSQDNPNLFWDNTNNRLGIGTNTPREGLEVIGNVQLQQTDSSGTLGVIMTTVGAAPHRFIHNSGDPFNFFAGVDSGNFSVNGTNNTSVGSNTLASTTSGGSNTALGSGALFNNSTGAFNTALGVNTLVSNTNGFQNIAIGPSSLQSNTIGFNNNASGINALFSTTTGIQNIGIGQNAGRANTTGSNNTFIGNEAGNSGTSGDLSGSTALGNNAQVTASNSVILGSSTAKVGIGLTAPNAKLHLAGGDLAVSTQGNGVVLRATDGPNCYRVTVDNTGTLSSTLTSCP